MSKMLAWVLQSANKLEYKEVDIPACIDDDVLIKFDTA